MWLANTAINIGVTFGSASVGAVTVSITRADGTALVTDAAATDNADGTYSYQLSRTLNTRPDLLLLDWKVTATGEVVTLHEEIVGSLLFTIAEARAERTTGLQSPLASTTDYPTSELAIWRAQITAQFEAKTSKSWVRRHCRVILPGTGSRNLSLVYAKARHASGEGMHRPGRQSHIAKVIAATIDGVAVDLADIMVGDGELYHTNGTWSYPTSTDPFNVVVEYEYGDLVVDLEARRHGLSMILAKAQPSDISSYASSFSNQDGSQGFTSEAGWAYPRDVWEWLKRSKHGVMVA